MKKAKVVLEIRVFGDGQVKWSENRRAIDSVGMNNLFSDISLATVELAHKLQDEANSHEKCSNNGSRCHICSALFEKE